MKSLTLLGMALQLAALLCGCFTVSAEPASDASNVKNVVLVIGDGMGMEHIGVLAAYAALAPSSIYKERESYLEKAIDQSELGLAMVNNYNSLVADSACAGTQIASAVSCRPESLGLDEKGNAAPTLLELAQKNGKSAGLITDTRLSHATPASFVVHIPSRHLENEIAEKLAVSSADILLGGGLRYWLPKNTKDTASAAYWKYSTLLGSSANLSSKRKDSLDVVELAKQNGFTAVFNRFQLAKAPAGKVLGLFASSGMLDGISYSRQKPNRRRLEPTLEEMADFALTRLSEDPDGFFLMIEAGQIDWASHSNDAGSLLHEMIKLDHLVGYLLRWLEGRDDTLLLITADHATGLPGFSYSAYRIPEAQTAVDPAGGEIQYSMLHNYGSPETLDRIYSQKRAFFRIANEFSKLSSAEQTAEKLVEMVNASGSFPLTPEQARRIIRTEENRYYYPKHPNLSKKTVPKINDFAAFYPNPKGNLAPLIARELAEQQNFVWGTGAHSSSPVPVIALGPKFATEPFKGMYPLVQTGKILREVLIGEE